MVEDVKIAEPVEAVAGAGDADADKVEERQKKIAEMEAIQVENEKLLKQMKEANELL